MENPINIFQLTNAVTAPYFNEELTQLNDHCLRVSVMTAGYPWHMHPNSDETFIVIEGTLIIETKTMNYELDKGHCLTIPQGIPHRTAPKGDRCANLTIELKNIDTVFM